MKVRNIRQVISTLLTTALLFSLMSMSAFAADTTVDLSFDVPDLSVQNYNSKEAFLRGILRQLRIYSCTPFL